MKPILDIMILAHGYQTRLPALGTLPKCLIQLPECNETIIERTVRMVLELVGPSDMDAWVTVVGGRTVADALLPQPWRLIEFPAARGTSCRLARGMSGTGLYAKPIDVLTYHETPETAPRCALSRLLQVMYDHDSSHAPVARRVVLLGDTIWSRDALRRVLLEQQEPEPEEHRPVLFAGTPDLSTSGGELFAIAWDGSENQAMMQDLRDCPRSAHHDVPQPGQLRRLLWHRRGNKDSPLGDPQYMIISDWTRDIDTDADLARVPTLDVLAALEEREYLSSLLSTESRTA